MATVFMKWLERRPQDYDRGIQLLTLGRLGSLQAQIVRHLIRDGIRVLEIGCGTGGLTRAMAEAGAVVTAIDISQLMLAEAERKIQQGGLGDKVDLKLMDAALIGTRFDEGSFDLVVSSLALSEMTTQARAYVLKTGLTLLAPGGRLAILDEVLPENLTSRLIYAAVRLPLRFLTWSLTRTTTHPLKDFVASLSQAGYATEVVASKLGVACSSSSLPQAPRSVLRPSRARFEIDFSVAPVFAPSLSTFGRCSFEYYRPIRK